MTRQFFSRVSNQGGGYTLRVELVRYPFGFAYFGNVFERPVRSGQMFGTAPAMTDMVLLLAGLVITLTSAAILRERPQPCGHDCICKHLLERETGLQLTAGRLSGS